MVDDESDAPDEAIGGDRVDETRAFAKRTSSSMAEPPVVPEYNKPDAEGIWMNFDNTLGIYHVVRADDTFEQAAAAVFDYLKKAQEDFPDWPRVFYVDIEAHEGEQAGFDADFYEFQQEFFFSTIAPFLTGFELPLTGPLINPDRQRNDLPDELVIKAEDGA